MANTAQRSATATQKPETKSETKPVPPPVAGDGLSFDEADWPTKGPTPPPAAMVEKIKESWSQRTTANGREIGKPFALPVKDAEDATTRERQLRNAAGSVSLGVAIKRETVGDRIRLVFRARPKRKTNSSGE